MFDSGGIVAGSYYFARSVTTILRFLSLQHALPMFAITCAVRVCAQGAAVVISEEPAGAITNVGGVASFWAGVMGSAPITFQWQHDGQNIAGGTRAILVISPASLNDAGKYQVRIQNRFSSATSGLASLTVNPAPAQPIVDPRFHGDARLNTSPTHVQVLANGQVMLGPALEGRIVRLQTDGSIDSDFKPGLPEPPFSSLSLETRVDQFLEQPNGQLLVTGNFATYERQPVPGLVRLNRDGARDETFALPADLALVNRSRVALQSDGKILVLSTRGLLRLGSDGRFDPAFAATVGAGSNIAAFAMASGDRIYVGLSREQVITRLLPDGAEDPRFIRRAVDVDLTMKLHALADGRLIVNGVRPVSGWPSGRFIWTLARWFEDGTPDPTFPVLDVPLFTAPAPDGMLYFADGSTISADGSRAQLNLGFGPYDSPVSTYRFPAVFGPDGRIYLFGGFSFYHGVSSARVVRLNRVPAGGREVDQPPKILAAWADETTVTLGQGTVLRVAPVAPGPVTYEWRRLNFDGSIAQTFRTNTPKYEFTPRYMVERGNWTVRVLNSAGEAVSAPIAIILQPAELRIVRQPTRVALAPGRLGSLPVELSPYFGGVAQSVWTRDGVLVARTPNQETRYPRALENGGTGVWLELGPVAAAQAGTYRVTVTDSTGRTVTSRPIVVTVEDTPRFVNLSTRAFVGEDEQAIVLGFVIPPGLPRGIMVRGIGPTLAQFGVGGALEDARLELFDQSGRRKSVNDHWREVGSSTDIARLGAFALAPESKDAMLMNGGLSPGAYTARLSGPPGVTGIGLIELYETDNQSDRIVNLSSRVFVGPDGSPAIAGLAIRGAGGKRVLVRAAGPALAAFGVTGPLTNPRLEVRDAGGALLVSNDGWSQQSEAEEVSRAAISAGAFPFAAGSRDAALVITLPAGNFTVLVTGTAPSDAGVVLIEVYEVP
jgi:hypothetical protein